MRIHCNNSRIKVTVFNATRAKSERKAPCELSFCFESGVKCDLSSERNTFADVPSSDRF